MPSFAAVQSASVRDFTARTWPEASALVAACSPWRPAADNATASTANNPAMKSNRFIGYLTCGDASTDLLPAVVVHTAEHCNAAR